MSATETYCYQTSSVETPPAAPARESRSLDLAELLVAAVQADEVNAACQAVADQLQRRLGVQAVALAWCGPRGRRCRLRGLSGVSEFDRQSPWIRNLETLLEEAVLRGRPHTYTAGAGAATASQKRVAQESDAGFVWSAPLCSPAGTPVGAWGILGLRGASPPGEVLQRLTAWEPLVARALALVGQTQRGGWTRRVWAARGRHKRLATLIAGVIAATVLAWPMPYQVSCDCALQPVSRRYVAAPFDAKLDEALAEPGDLVAQGEPLAKLDGGELQMELAALQADVARASKLHDTSLVGGDVAGAQMAVLEIERLKLRTALVEERIAGLTVAAPLAGLVLSGDPKKTEGSPVNRGQILFEIAPLEKLVAEILIPDEDIRMVQPGQPVRIVLDSQPGLTHDARLGAIQPRAELRDGQNVFVAEVALDNPEEILRPGMRGRAKVVTASHPLAWNLFHKGFDDLASWMSW